MSVENVACPSSRLRPADRARVRAVRPRRGRDRGPCARTAGRRRLIASVAPVASAPASKQCSTRGRSIVELAERAATRAIHVPSVCAGTTFAASPPWVTMPWTWSNGRRCWRSKPIATCATVNASAALMPSSGAIAACDSRPVYCTPNVRDRADARVEILGRRRVHHRSPRARRRTRRVRASGSCRRRPPRRACRSRDNVMPSSSTSGASASPAPTAHRGDDVVPARVPDHRQRVVLGADRDVQRTVADPAAMNAVGRSQMPTSTGEAGVGEHARGPRARLRLLELQLGVRVDRGG